MKCEEVQPILLDFSRGLLSGIESRQVESHLGKCAECAAVLEEETSFARRLASVPVVEPANDVWALVRAKTRPRRFRPIARLRELGATRVGTGKAVTAIALGAVASVMLCSMSLTPPVSRDTRHQNVTQVKWSDDPLGKHTDAMVEFIDRM